jgi:hypothetical protein
VNSKDLEIPAVLEDEALFLSDGYWLSEVRP